MTLYLLVKKDLKHVVRAKDEDEARLMLVDLDKDPSWVDPDLATAAPIFSSGRKQIIV